MHRKYHDPFHKGYFYHLFNRGINQELVFKSRRNYMFFLRRWQEYIGDLVDVYAYCLLPTHFHFLIKVAEDAASVSNPFRVTNTDMLDINKILEKQFELFFRSYAQAFNKENKRSGSLFKKRFKRIYIDDESYYPNLVHAIHINPVFHQIVEKPNLWHFSSFDAFLTDKPTRVQRSDMLKRFASRSEFQQIYLDMPKYLQPAKYWIEE